MANYFNRNTVQLKNENPLFVQLFALSTDIVQIKLRSHIKIVTVKTCYGSGYNLKLNLGKTKPKLT